MTVKLNHTIVHSKDPRAAASFFAEVFGLEKPVPFGPFLDVQVGNEVTLAFLDAEGMEVQMQHYAFLVSEPEFDAIFSRPDNQIFKVVFYPDRVYHARYLNATRSERYRYTVQEVRSQVDITALKGEVYLDGLYLTHYLRIEYRASRLVDQLEEAGILGADQGGNQGRAVLVGGEQEQHTQASPPKSPPPRIIGGEADGGAEPPARPRVWM